MKQLSNRYQTIIKLLSNHYQTIIKPLHNQEGFSTKKNSNERLKKISLHKIYIYLRALFSTTKALSNNYQTTNKPLSNNYQTINKPFYNKEGFFTKKNFYQ